MTPIILDNTVQKQQNDHVRYNEFHLTDNLDVDSEHVYTTNDKILIVGECNFSFSVALAKAIGFGKNIISTAYQYYESKADENVKICKQLGVTVIKDIDATNIDSLQRCVDANNGKQFDHVIFTFPRYQKIAEDIDDDNLLFDISNSDDDGFFQNLAMKMKTKMMKMNKRKNEDKDDENEDKESTSIMKLFRKFSKKYKAAQEKKAEFKKTTEKQNTWQGYKS
eukprot:UN23867